MKLLRTVQASNSHSADWYECSRGELVTRFGSSTVDKLVTSLGNGKESVSNYSAQTAKGEPKSCEVQLTTDYPTWTSLAKPAAALRFFLVELRPTQ